MGRFISDLHASLELEVHGTANLLLLLIFHYQLRCRHNHDWENLPLIVHGPYHTDNLQFQKDKVHEPG